MTTMISLRLHDRRIRDIDGMLTGGKRMDIGWSGWREHLVDRGWVSKCCREQLPWPRHLRVASSELETQGLCRLRVELHPALQHKKPG